MKFGKDDGGSAGTIATARTPVAPSVPSTSNEFDVTTRIPGYVTAADAAARRNSNSTVPIGHYAVFNRSKGMVNVTRRAGVPGFWINPGDLP